MRKLSLLLILFVTPAQAGVNEARAAFADGLAAVEAGDDRTGDLAFRTAIEGAPTWILPYLELGELAARRREGIGEVRLLLAKVGAMAAANPRYHRILGDLSELEGDDRASVSAWATSLELLPEQHEVRAKRASALERLGHHEDAAEEYGKLVASQPFDLVYRARYAHALEQAGLYARAWAQLGILVEKEPGKEAPLRRLARFHERRGEAKEAARLHAEADRAGRRPAVRNLRPLLPSRR